MRKCIFIWPFILATIFSVFFAPLSADAAIASTSPVKLLAVNPTADATVNLYCQLRSKNRIYSTSGTGVFVSDRGVILTNAHVAQYFLLARDAKRIKGQCVVRTGSPAESAYTADVLYFPTTWIDANAEALKKQTLKGSGEHDFALLYVTGAAKTGATLPTTFPALPVSLLNTVEGDTVTVAGYPTGGQDAKGIKRALSYTQTTAAVTSTRRFSNDYGFADLITIASSSAASAGVSGGPLVNSTGSLTGIVTAKSESQLRAITLSYINAKLVDQLGTTVYGVSLGDLAARATANSALVSGKQLGLLRDSLLKKR